MNTSKRTTALAATAALALSLVPAAAHAEPRGFIEVEQSIGYFYGTFDGDPLLSLLVGGSAEEMCLDAPDDPFGQAEPGSAPMRIFERSDGTTDLKINDRNQPLYLYETDVEAAVWIGEVCAAYFEGTPVPEPLATGTGDLKVRISVLSEADLDIYNGVNGELTGADGTEYRVRASADFEVRDGQLTEPPWDFVSLDLTEIGR